MRSATAFVGETVILLHPRLPRVGVCWFGIVNPTQCQSYTLSSGQSWRQRTIVNALQPHTRTRTHTHTHTHTATETRQTPALLTQARLSRASMHSWVPQHVLLLCARGRPNSVRHTVHRWRCRPGHCAAAVNCWAASSGAARSTGTHRRSRMGTWR